MNKNISRYVLVFGFLLISIPGMISARQILVPMDASQTNHLKAYGLIYNHISAGNEAQWLLNYRGGSFLTPHSDQVIRNARQEAFI